MHLKTRKRQSAKGVDYGFATQTAREFIQLYNINWLPVDVFDLVDAYATAENLNIETKTISDLSIETGLDRQTLIDDFIYGEDGLAIYDPVIKKYTILINEKAEPFGRVRWTVAHELGHIVLEHLSDTRTTINKWDLSPDEYNEREQEAHIFAGEILSPKFIIYRIGAHSAAEIEDICELSTAASISRENAIRELINDKTKMHDSMLSIIPTFAKFLEFKTLCCEPKDMRIQSRIQQNPPAKKQAAALSVATLPSGKYEQCPFCGNVHNSEISIYCKLCGTLLYETPPTILPDAPCNALGDKDASFCEHCGHTVYKTRFGIETPYDEL